MAGGGLRTKTDTSWIAFHLLTLARQATRCPPWSLRALLPTQEVADHVATVQGHMGATSLQARRSKDTLAFSASLLSPACCLHELLKTGLPLPSPPGQTRRYLEESACTKPACSLAFLGWLVLL